MSRQAVTTSRLRTAAAPTRIAGFSASESSAARSKYPACNVLRVAPRDVDGLVGAYPFIGPESRQLEPF